MGRRKSGERKVCVQVVVTTRELELLRDEILPGPEYVDRFREAGGEWVAKFTASDLDDIVGHVAAAANHARRAKLRDELDALYEQLESYEALALRLGDAF
ncbi:MAG: hypothetical protein ACYDIE_06030 [Candidatus Krumholzibacteriia bacterium]